MSGFQATDIPSAHYLRGFVSERLTAAAEEIVSVFEQAVARYREEIYCHRKRLERSSALAQQNDCTYKEDQQLSHQERIPSLDEEEPGLPQIKDIKLEESCTRHERQRLLLKQETGTLLRISTKNQKLSQQQDVCEENVLCEQQLYSHDRSLNPDQEQPDPLMVKEERGELRQDDEQLPMKQESDSCLVTSAYRDGDGEHESGTEHLFYHNPPAVGSQDQTGSYHVGSESTEDVDLIPLSLLLDSPRDTDPRKKSIQCEFCGKAFRDNYHMRVHRRIHTGEKPYVCETCGKGFRERDNLLSHMRTHTGEKPYSCQTCGKSFSSNGNLTTHMRSHTGEKPYSCEICGKRFSRNSNVTVHMRIHTGEKPYSCEICAQSFRKSGDLIAHMRTHTGEKPYPCNTCGKRFFRLSHLKCHVRSHTGERPYVCTTCGKTYSQLSALKKHTNTHAGEKPHSCDVCGKNFQAQDNLLHHMKIHTGEKP